MNIKGAKKQVKNAVVAYLSKDEYGSYRIPIERQRPLFLVGPPGIGKTDIMAQVAEEMDIALVAYSMTHHTRQSALGLPFIQQREYDGQEFRTTEYTMSEIIASVYDMMKATGKREGILFLDEINCISETLAPSMLQFLQFKIVGRHRVPEGWVVITAGNPAEYNNSVRDFDLATMDRLKRIDVEPDFAVWKAYAENEGIHSSVLSYLEVKKDDFYSVRTTVDGKQFVTARGWVDLSEMIYLYEDNDMSVNIDLVGQYIRDERIARDFTAYYDLFFQYRKEYDVEAILKGKVSSEVIENASNASFDERVTIIRLISDALQGDFRSVYTTGEVISFVMEEIKAIREELVKKSPEEALIIVEELEEKLRESHHKTAIAHKVSRYEERAFREKDSLIKEIVTALNSKDAKDTDTKEIIRECMSAKNEERKELASETGIKLENAFSFIEKAYDESNEMLIFVTTLTEDKFSADFIGQYGSDSYYKHNKGLLLYEREKDLMEKITNLEE